jgi:glycosyltransferase involved in cell wall biosynthesis
MVEIGQINVLTWNKDDSEQLEFPNNVSIYECFNPKHSLSIFRTLKRAINDDSDIFIYNIMPTAYGRSIIANFVGLISPIIMKTIFHKKVMIIYHNSIHTNDFRKLGYHGMLNYIKAKIIINIEKLLFKTVETYFLSRTYSSHIKAIDKNFNVKTLELPYLQTVGTLMLNNVLDKEVIDGSQNTIPVILLFGNWGPQKDPESSLKALKNLWDLGVQFRLIVAGDINVHFPTLNERINGLFRTYSEIIYQNLGRVKEKDLMNLFLNSDLVIIDYNVPGGFSSVLASAMFFQKFIISRRFDEFVSQAEDYDKIIFYNENELEKTIRKYIVEIHPNAVPEKINIRNKIVSMKIGIKSMLNS